jgi:pimeloyl-ACP methyl ester carboxylesterase
MSRHRHKVTIDNAGYRIVKPILRSCSCTNAPVPLDHYTTLHIVGDFVARLDALGEPHAFVVDHNWAATAAWDLCLFRPDRILLWGMCLGFEQGCL